MSNVMDNLEQIGHKRSGSATQVNGYDESQDIGPINDFSRDFHANGRVVGITSAPGVRESLPTDMQDDSSSSPSDMASPQGSTGTADDPAYMRESPAAEFTTSQQVVLASGGAQQVAQAKANRRSMVIMNIDPTNYVYIGTNSAVTENNGFPLVPGAAMPLYVSGDVWGVSNADVKVAIIETMGFSS